MAIIKLQIFLLIVTVILCSCWPEIIVGATSVSKSWSPTVARMTSTATVKPTATVAAAAATTAATTAAAKAAATATATATATTTVLTSNTTTASKAKRFDQVFFFDHIGCFFFYISNYLKDYH